ncbi:unnamed protein product [Choristocarpus tenellus]
MIGTQELARLRGCAAFVIKPSILGSMEKSARLCRRAAAAAGVKAVLSSVFESGVGLAHASIFASVFADKGVAHGLSTYARLCNDVVSPGFLEAVAGGSMVNIASCERLLNVAAKGGVAC